MFFRKQYLSLLICALATAVVVFAARQKFLFADDAFLQFPKTSLGGFFPLLQFSTNSFFSWRFEPLSQLLFAAFGYHAYFGSLIFLTAVGISLLLQTRSALKPLLASALASLLVLLFVLWFGLDLALWSFLLVLVWQLLAFQFAANLEVGSRKSEWLLILSTIVACGFANSLALISTVIAALVSAPVAGGAVSVLLAFLYSLFIPPVQFPEYAALGHLVPQYGVVDGLQPLVGDKPRLLHIDREFVRAAFGAPALFLLAITSLFSLILRVARKSSGGSAHLRKLEIAAFVFSVSLLLDTNAVSADLNQIAPLQSLSRIIPNLFSLSLAPFALAAGTLFLLLLSIQTSSTLLLFVLLTFGLARLPLSTRSADEALWRSADAIQDESVKSRAYAALQTPSYWLVRKYGVAIIADGLGRSGFVYERASHFPVSVIASSNADDVSRLLDGKDGTAWSSGGGAQRGTEWLKFAFSSPQKLGGIRLETGKYFTDFPRGVEVLTSSSCDLEPELAKYKTVFREDKAEGEILYTSEGMPFFSEQYTFAATFPPEEIGCIWVRQIGKESHFDWSVSEVLFAKPQLGIDLANRSSE